MVCPVNSPNPPPPQTVRQTFWRVVWVILGLALCGSGIAALMWKINKTLNELEGFDVFLDILIGVCVAMLLFAGGFGLLGAGIGGSGTLDEPSEHKPVPYDDPQEAGRQLRLRIRARLYRAGCMLLGLALALLGPQLIMDGLNDPPSGIHQTKRQGGGSVGGGLAMTLFGLVLILYSVVAMGPSFPRNASARVPDPTPPHAEHDFTP